MSGLRVELPPEVVDALVERVAAVVVERLAERTSTAERSEYLNVSEAAELLRCSRQRVYDLVSSGRLTRYRDGSRVLVSRAELDAHLGSVDPRMIHRRRGRMATGAAR